MKHQSDLTLILSCKDIPAVASFKEYESVCDQLILVCENDEVKEAIKQEYTIVSWRAETGKVVALNEAIRQAECAHILWLEEGETIPGIPKLTEGMYHVGDISNHDTKTPALNRQIRLFPNMLSASLKGFEIPDMYEAAQRFNWQLSSHHIYIKSVSPVFTIDAIQREVERGTGSPMHTFWKGLFATENEKFTQGINCLKKALNAKEMASWNELAALNSLANNYMETHQLVKAKETALKSLDKSLKQRAPFLTLYQCYNFEGALAKAYDILEGYTKVAAGETDANWDVYLPKAQAAFLMGEFALRLGHHKKAYHHYEQFYQLNDGQISEEVLEKLFLYAVELQERGKAIQYFEALFGGKDELEEGQTTRIKEALSLFADKGWYDYTSQIYQKLVAVQPNNDALRNGLIRTLIKNNEISKAQALL